MPLIYIMGWCGTVIYLASYAYLALVPHCNRNLYFIANAIAGSLLTFSSLALETWQAVVINGFWVVVSILALRGRTLPLGFLNRTRLRVLVATVLGTAALLWAVSEHHAIETLGWSSACAFCGSYLLFAGRALAADEFHLFNAYAATAILPALASDQNWPVLVLEICWLGLSIIAFVRHLHRGVGLPAEVEDEP